MNKKIKKSELVSILLSTQKIRLSVFSQLCTNKNSLYDNFIDKNKQMHLYPDEFWFMKILIHIIKISIILRNGD